jgi:hypothetical protein
MDADFCGVSTVAVENCSPGQGCCDEGSSHGHEMMWIQLADSDGQAVSLNATHLVMIKEHGDRARVVHACCEVAVLQSHAAAIGRSSRP